MRNTLPDRVRLGVFEVNLRTGELRDGDAVILLADQLFQILRILIERDGQLVTREEIRKRLWPNDTVVEFDHSINAAIKRLRQALGDSAEDPKYIETLARRGYRLLIPVEWLAERDSSSYAAPVVSPDDDGTATRMQAEPTGRTVSHYRVLDVIGGGGMGVVYRAEDLKLGRQVALKFLPEDLGNEPQAMERFSREARAASSLDHVNICSIHEFGEHDGQPFIVMPLLRGQNLRDRLAALAANNEMLPLQQLLDIAIQIADGLRAAHEKGIIHRDIKPANIVITDQSVVKILDFGLAKLLEGSQEEQAAAAVAGASTSTSTLHLTRTGSAMGTAGYMSPEQVRGEKLDPRTDVFSFGLVLYEMATGHRAFSGDTAAKLHSAILNDTPAPARELNSETPSVLASVIDRSLKKERRERYQSAAQLRSALQEVQSEIAPPAASLRHVKRVAVIGVALLLIVAVAVCILWWRRPLAKVAFKNYSMTLLTSTGNVAVADISPDGRYLAYADDEIGKQSIWVKQLATSTTLRVLGPVSSLGYGIRFTRDGNYLYYSQLEADGSRFALYRLAIVGGTPEKILNDIWNGGNSAAVEFSPDGRQMVFARYTDKENDLLIANADGSGEKRVLALPVKEHIRPFAWAPDGQTIAFGIDELGAGGSNCVALIASSGSKERRIVRNVRAISAIAWLPDQSGLVLTGAPPETDVPAPWIVSLPDASLRRVTNDLADYRGVSLTEDSKRWVTLEKQMDSSLWVAPAGNPTQAVQLRQGAGKQDGMRGIAWLPDGRLVYADGVGKSELWLLDRDRGRLQVTHLGAAAEEQSATPGGTIVFSTDSPTPGIWTIGPDGSNLRQIVTAPAEAWAPEMSPDGKWITYITTEGSWKMSLPNGKRTRLDPKGVFPTISPDGHWVAFSTWGDKPSIEIVASDGSGSPHFLSFPIEPQVPESTSMGDLPIRWTADGKAITYVRTKDGASNIWAQPVDGSPAKQLTNFTSMYIWRHAWSPDGKYLVMARGNFSRDAVMLTDTR
jgi:serine/threonine protein kinase/Tol biopolymer transport system component